MNRNGSGSSNRDSSYGGENGYNNEENNDEERWVVAYVVMTTTKFCRDVNSTEMETLGESWES